MHEDQKGNLIYCYIIGGIDGFWVSTESESSIPVTTNKPMERLFHEKIKMSWLICLQLIPQPQVNLPQAQQLYWMWKEYW